MRPQPNSNSSTPSPSPQKTTNPSPTPDEPSHTQPRSLTKGDQGRDVLQLQQKLQSLGYFNDGLSGSFNDSTHTAVIRFQQNRKITADGVVGQLTRQALEVASTPSVQGGTPTPSSTPGGSQPQIKAPSPSPVPSELLSPTPGTSSPSTSPSPYRLTVKEMQQLLKKQGFYAGEVDGELNDLTRAAIIAAQDYFKIDESTIWSGRIPSSNSTQS
ncbi:MAG: peptidoglycan-binding domain-containing protein [Synechococcales cyanobacterium]